MEYLRLKPCQVPVKAIALKAVLTLLGPNVKSPFKAITFIIRVHEKNYFACYFTCLKMALLKSNSIVDFRETDVPNMFIWPHYF